MTPRCVRRRRRRPEFLCRAQAATTITPRAPSGAADQSAAMRARAASDGGRAAARLRCSSYFLTAASANNFARPGDMGLWMNR